MNQLDQAADHARRRNMTGDDARAFNEGSDARLAGEPVTANPYTKREDTAYFAWRAGWRDVDHYWPRPLPSRPLPREISDANTECRR